MELSVKATEMLAAASSVATEHDVLDHITELVEETGSQKELASKIGVSQVFLNDVLHGRRTVGGKIAEYLGWKRVVLFLRNNGTSAPNTTGSA